MPPSSAQATRCDDPWSSHRHFWPKRRQQCRRFFVLSEPFIAHIRRDRVRTGAGPRPAPLFLFGRRTARSVPHASATQAQLCRGAAVLRPSPQNRCVLHSYIPEQKRIVILSEPARVREGSHLQPSHGVTHKRADSKPVYPAHPPFSSSTKHPSLLRSGYHGRTPES